MYKKLKKLHEDNSVTKNVYRCLFQAHLILKLQSIPMNDIINEELNKKHILGINNDYLISYYD